ncbi:MAG TPA: phosphatase domain-containing protein [Gemmatimonadaceae bacterium]|nr:phosphatase domain-containing protein [Gemmatimonadaceae bacterium]
MADNPISRIISDMFAIGAAARDTLIDALPHRPDCVTLYRGFGAAGRLMIMGRALRDDPLPAAAASDTPWKNLVAMLRRADANPIPHASIRVVAGNVAHDFIADDEGFFSGWMDVAAPARVDDEWVRIGADLRELPLAGGHADGRAYYPDAMPEQLVVSDIDDTVLQSRVTHLLHAVRTIAFGNARTRLPFPGVAAFYRALRRGPAGDGRNPLFYVSSSPWNLYDVISQFLEIQDIPAGPIMLRDVDLSLDALSSRHHHMHKREMIRRVLTTYPDVPVILIGDSSQQDPEIYRDTVREYAGRVRAVYIRNVTMTDERSRAIQALANEILDAGSSLVLADDTLAAARHAAEHGYIAEDSLESIASDKSADEGRTGGKVDAPGARDAGDTPTPTVVVEEKRS